jgi:hypothetical protein
MGPGDGELPGFVPLRLVLWRDDELVIVLRDVEAHRTGVVFGITLLHRRGSIDPFSFHAAMGGASTDSLRLGVGFADGRRTSIEDQVGRMWNPLEPPDGPLLMFRGGSGGGGNRFEMRLWLWPLPPPGDLTLALEWSSRGVPETIHVIDAQTILDAAERAEHLWDPEPPDPRSWGRRGRVGGVSVVHAVARAAPEPPDPNRSPEVAGDGPADRSEAAAEIERAFRTFHGDDPDLAVAVVEDGADLLDARRRLPEFTQRWTHTVTALDTIVFEDADRAILRSSVHGVALNPFKIDARFVRTADGWRMTRASALHVLRLAGLQVPPE